MNLISKNQVDNCHYLQFSMSDNYIKGLKRLRKNMYKHYSNNQIIQCAINVFKYRYDKPVDRVCSLVINRLITNKIFAAIVLDSQNNLYPMSLKFIFVNNYWRLLYYKIADLDKNNSDFKIVNKIFDYKL
ncbi:MAG: hypothetical protein LBT99_00955 [Bifidobacteriaceae bacterium]|jgi:hypothetical protein|nr:hypothetical protein [Bifidobacteriaceae bacterium]